MIKRLSSNSFIRAVVLAIVLVTVLTLIIPVSGGCGSGSEGTSPTAINPGTSSPVPGSSVSNTPQTTPQINFSDHSANTLMELFSLVPADEASGAPPVFFTVYDHALLYKDNNITFTDFQELLDKLTVNHIAVRLFTMGSDITGYGSQAQYSTIRDQYVGYNAADVDAEILFGLAPTNSVGAIGRFDPQATEEAFNNQSEWPPRAVTDYATEEYRGVIVHSWGDGTKTNMQYRLVPPHIDNLGRARPLAISDRYLFNSGSVENVKLMIDASQGDKPSLDDLPEYAAIANGLTDLKSYAAIVGSALTANGILSRLDDTNFPMTEEEKALFTNNTEYKLKNFITFGSGVSADEKGNYTAIVIYHENAANAQENVSRLKNHIDNDMSVFLHVPWSNIFTGAEIKSEGNVLLAKLYCKSMVNWASWVYAQDNLLFHEE